MAGAGVSGQAGSGGLMPWRVRWWSSVSIRSARSSWSQAAPKFGADGAAVGAAGDGVVQQPGGLGAVGVGGGAGVGAQVVAQVAGDGAGLGEGDQGAGERGGLGAGGEPDGEPAGGDVVDGRRAGVGGGQAVGG